MQYDPLAVRGKAGFVLLLALLLAGCDIFAPQPVPPTGGTFPTITRIPTETIIPTITPIPARATSASTPPSILSLLNNPTSLAQSAPGGAQPATTATPTAATAPPAAAPTNTPLPIGQLTGRFLGLLPSSKGLWAMRADGTRVTLLTSDPIIQLLVSPTGWAAAYITNPDPDAINYPRPFGYTLKFITFYDDKIHTITSLDPPGLSPSSPQDALDSAVQSINAYNHGAWAWSPDGGKLAFTSANQAASNQPGSSDVYVYILGSAQLRRMTHLQFQQGPVHPYELSWSPNGQNLYFAGAYNFGAGSGYWMAGAWVIGLDGSSRQVALGDITAGESLLAWLTDGTVLLSSWNSDCGNQNLRATNLTSGQSTSMWSGCYGEAQYERLHNDVIVSITPDLAGSTAGYAAGGQPGLYLVNVGLPQAQQITNHSFERIFLGRPVGPGSADWYGFNQGEGLLAIQRNGDIHPLFTGAPYDGSTGASLRPLLRLLNGNWLWAGDGLYLCHPGSPPHQITTVPVENVTSSPTDSGLYFFLAHDGDTNRLYGVHSRNWQPFIVDPRITNPQEIDWTG